MIILNPLVPAEAGTQAFFVSEETVETSWVQPARKHKNTWVPAFAGMSGVW